MTAEDQKLIEAADCDEIIKERCNFFCGREQIELTAYREAIAAEGRKKNCKL